LVGVYDRLDEIETRDVKTVSHRPRRDLYFWPLATAVLVWWLARRSQDPLRGWRAVMDRDLLDALTVGKYARDRWRGAGLLAGWLLAVVAVAGPTWRPEPSPFADDPVPVMLLLRAGETMDQSDLVPSRMERARLKIADYAAERKGQPLGLAAYAGSAHLVLPPTRDTSVVATMAADISPAIMPKPGDDLASALKLAARTLGSDGGSIVIVADTVDEGNDDALAEFARESSLPLRFLAIARAETPEQDAVQRAASALNATVTLMTADLEDVRSLVRSTARAPVATASAGEGTRWAEAGW
jgi:Ca-activated chloride channel family protein